MIIYDCETGPLSRKEIIDRSDPFKPLVLPPPFDPSQVKLGNMKDEKKIAEKIEASRKKREKEIEEAEEKHATELAEHEAKIIDRAALSAVTGSILVTGYMTPDGQMVDDADEADQLKRFWDLANECRENGDHLAGWNIYEFDLPFQIHRSWFHRVRVPEWILDKNRYWHPVFVDLLVIWKRGSRNSCSLDVASKFFGGQGKQGRNGGDFHGLWTGNREQKSQAIEYLIGDLMETWTAAERMGVL